MQFSFGKYFLKSGNSQLVHKKKVNHIFIKLNLREIELNQFFYCRLMIYGNTVKIEICNGFEQYIDAFIPMESFSRIEALRHILEHKRGVHTMLISGLS